MKIIISGILISSIVGCAMGPNYKRAQVEMPGEVYPGASQNKEIDLGWWRQFGDKTLDSMVQIAIKNNLDLEAALARVDEARASLGIAKSSWYPTLDLKALAAKERISETGPLFSPGVENPVTDYSLGLSLSYEIDLWGKVRRSNEAAKAELFAADYNRANIQLTMISQVVSTYFLLRSLDLQLQIAKDTFESRKNSYDLINKRYKGGLSSELNARQSEAEMHSANATVSQLEVSVSKAESALGILLGQNPKQLIEGKLDRGARLDQIPVPPDLPSLLPSSLLERRPDIASAEQKLVAENARIGLAKSYYFPSISLIGGLGTESKEFSDLFKGASSTWSYGLNLGMPIFNAGKTGFLVDTATARQEQALAQYKKSIQVAFTEVRDAIKNYNSGKLVVDAQKLQLAAVERNYYLANLRYKNGQSPYLEVLDAERQLFQVQLALVQSQQGRLVSVVDLYKALGGGWTAKKEE